MLFFLIFKEFYNASQEDKCSKQTEPGKEALKDPVANQSTVRVNNLSEQEAGSIVGLVAYHIVNICIPALTCNPNKSYDKMPVSA